MKRLTAIKYLIQTIFIAFICQACNNDPFFSTIKIQEEVFNVEASDSIFGSDSEYQHPTYDSYRGDYITITLKATDPDDDDLNYFAGPLPRGAGIDSEEGIIIWAVPMDYSGSSVTIYVTVEDKKGNWDAENITISIS